MRYEAELEDQNLTHRVVLETDAPMRAENMVELANQTVARLRLSSWDTGFSEPGPAIHPAVQSDLDKLLGFLNWLEAMPGMDIYFNGNPMNTTEKMANVTRYLRMDLIKPDQLGFTDQS